MLGLLLRYGSNNCIVQGFDSRFKSPGDEEFSLFQLGERVCDQILILPTTSKSLGLHLTVQSFIDFLDSEGNIIVVLSPEYELPSALHLLLSELGIYLPADRESTVVDHFNYDLQSSPENHDTLLVSIANTTNAGFLGNMTGDQTIAVPKAVGQILDSSSPLILPVLQAPTTAYSYDKHEEIDIVEEPFGTGRQLSLVSAMQARNSARVVVVGSAYMIEDSWFDAKVEALGGSAKKNGNFEFIRRLFGWAYKEFGVLKSGGIEHHLEQEAEIQSSMNSARGAQKAELNVYRIKNRMVCLS